MTNRQIAKTFQLLAAMMELHGENAFRIRAYRTAYDALKRLETPVCEMSRAEVAGIKGIGDSTAEKIEALCTTGSMERFDQYAKKTPEGVRALLMIKGLGPAKVRSIWKEMGITTPGELLYACNENRLIEYSGFGMKTQAEIRQQLEYHLESEGKYLRAVLEHDAQGIIGSLRSAMHGRIEWVGEYARGCPVIEHLECLAEGDVTAAQLSSITDIEVENTHSPFRCLAKGVYRFTMHAVSSVRYAQEKFERCAHPDFLNAWKQETGTDTQIPPENVPPELLEHPANAPRVLEERSDDLVTATQIRGILHCHTTSSDGLHSLREMAVYTRDAGYSYLGVTDHSKSAGYARGLQVERVLEQWREIGRLNQELASFRIFKGIESDILGDGRLDYDDEILAGFDFVIASIHSALQMDIRKATTRLIKAIEHPATRILGHATGRLLLARQGYPVDIRKVIDACAQNNVAIEVNANPQRLDLESAHLPYALEKGVWIAINPDAHSCESIHNVRHGVLEARRGGVPASCCLNTLSSAEFEDWCKRAG